MLEHRGLLKSLEEEKIEKNYICILMTYLSNGVVLFRGEEQIKYTGDYTVQVRNKVHFSTLNYAYIVHCLERLSYTLYIP